MSWCARVQQSYQVVSAGVVDHPALPHHCGAASLAVFDGLDHPHQGDVAAGGGAGEPTHMWYERTRTHQIIYKMIEMYCSFD